MIGCRSADYGVGGGEICVGRDGMTVETLESV